MTALLIAIPIAFLLGSIPCALLLGLARGVDIRKHGSRNVGATNLGRVLGGRWFFAGFALDALKGLVPVVVAGWLAGVLGVLRPEPMLAWAWLGVMISPVLGHMFSPWIGFKGGKGVATGFGALLGVFPALTIPVAAAFVVWLAVILTVRLMGLASTLAALTLPVAVGVHTALAGADHGRSVPFYVVTGLLALLVTWKHRGNLARTVRGVEPRFSLTGEGAVPADDAVASDHAAG